MKGYLPVMDSFGFETDLRVATSGLAFPQTVGVKREYEIDVLTLGDCSWRSSGQVSDDSATGGFIRLCISSRLHVKDTTSKGKEEREG